MGSPRAVLIFKTTHTYLRSGEISDNDKKKNSKVLQKEKKSKKWESVEARSQKTSVFHILKENYFESRIQTINQVWGQIKDIFQHQTTQNFRLQTWTHCVKKKVIQGGISAQCKTS